MTVRWLRVTNGCFLCDITEMSWIFTAFSHENYVVSHKLLKERERDAHIYTLLVIILLRELRCVFLVCLFVFVLLKDIIAISN